MRRADKNLNQTAKAVGWHVFYNLLVVTTSSHYILAAIFYRHNLKMKAFHTSRRNNQAARKNLSAAGCYQAFIACDEFHLRLLNILPLHVKAHKLTRQTRGHAAKAESPALY